MASKPVGSHTLARWRGQDVRLPELMSQLDNLRRTTERTATRTSVTNLVVLARNADEAGRASLAIAELGHRNPGRTIVVVCDADGPAGMDAEVSLQASTAVGHSLWSEQVNLRVGGEVCEQLQSVVVPLALPELPIIVWDISGLPDPQNPLLPMAHALLLDTRNAAMDEGGAKAALARVKGLPSTSQIVDLSWVRLSAWRQLLAGMFEGSVWRPFLSGVRRAEVGGKEMPRHLLGGWVASRLRLEPGRVTLVDQRHAGFRLEVEASGATGQMRVERSEGQRLVTATAEVRDGPSYSQVLNLPDKSFAWSLAHALLHPYTDPVYMAAVDAALTL
ncbi:MAG: glucose-6-phosphate dehydrogenase assembly protein OpcA [Acidimicrobiales bacterium]